MNITADAPKPIVTNEAWKEIYDIILDLSHKNDNKGEGFPEELLALVQNTPVGASTEDEHLRITGTLMIEQGIMVLLAGQLINIKTDYDASLSKAVELCIKTGWATKTNQVIKSLVNAVMGAMFQECHKVKS